MVISAPKVTPQTYPVLQEINRTGRVLANGDGNGELIAEVRALRAEGIGIIVVSSEPETVLSLADRILVMRRGQLAREFAGEAVGKDRLLEAA